jgi:hypothetical protein
LLVESSEDRTKVVVRFDEIFGRSEIAHNNVFRLGSRKIFTNCLPLVVSDMNYIFENSKTVAFDYLEMALRIREEGYTEEELLKDIYKGLFSSDLLWVIDNFVESTYDVGLDQQMKGARNPNEELQFTDQHAKVAHKSAMAMRILIPIISEFLEVHDIRRNENLLYTIFQPLFDLFQSEGVDVETKIFKLVESRVVTTRYSDRVIWAQLRNVATDTVVLTRLLFKRIIIQILPKLEHNRSVISFLHSVIRNYILYEFRTPFRLQYKPYNLNVRDGDGLSEFDKLEVSTVKVDEGLSLINRLTVRREIRCLLEEFGIVVGEPEVEYYEGALQINRLQTGLMSLFYAKHLGSCSSIYNATRKEYIILCIVMRRWLEENEFPVLAKYLTAAPEKYVEKKLVNKRQYLQRLYSSKRYKYLVNRKYHFVINNLVDGCVIERLIATLKMNTFYEVPDYGEDAPEEPAVIDERIEDITDEVLNFIERV